MLNIVPNLSERKSSKSKWSCWSSSLLSSFLVSCLPFGHILRSHCNNSFMSHFHFGKCFSVFFQVRESSLQSLFPLCPPLQTDNLLCVCFRSVCIYKQVHNLPLHLNDNAYTSYSFHLSTQNSIFVGFFFFSY